MNFLLCILSFLSFLILLASCQTPQNQTLKQVDTQTVSQDVAKPGVSQTPSFKALDKPAPTGSVSLQGNTLTLSVKLPPLDSAAFKTQLLDLSSASKILATVKDSYGKTYTPEGADANGRVNYPVNGVVTLAFNNIVPDPLLLAELKVLDSGLADIPQADIAVALRHTGVSNPAAMLINFQTEAVAKTLKELLALNVNRARTVDLEQLNTLMGSITGQAGTAPNYTYSQVHPTLVRISQLASDLQASNPNALTASNYRANGATVNLTVNGLVGSDKLQVQVTDAASAVKTNLGNGSGRAGFAISKATPGSNLKVKVSAFGSPSVSYSYSATPSTLTLTEGNAQNVTITATPNLTLTSFGPSSGPAGTEVTITGTGFTGATAVRFNGVDATSFVIDSNTQIRAFVPLTALDGKISVVNGSTVTSAGSFDVHRRIYVRAAAPAGGNGTSWANAYNHLKTAVDISNENDVLWVAAGTYKPHDSDITQSFTMKANVAMYGGFSGTESSLGMRNIAANPTILSGDLQNDDNTAVTPYTSATPNSPILLYVENNTILDGFTIQGGAESSVFGSYRNNVQLRNLIFRHNSAPTRGSGLRCVGGNVLVENTRFHNNAAGSFGGASEIQECHATFNNVIFEHNRVGLQGGALNISNGTLTTNNSKFLNNYSAGDGGAIFAYPFKGVSIQNTVFQGNAATGVSTLNIMSGSGTFSLNNVALINNTGSRALNLSFYNPTQTPISASLTNVLVANNTSDGYNILNFYGDSAYASLVLKNVTEANNTCPSQANQRCQITNDVASISTYQNVLLWKSYFGTNPAIAAGNVDLGLTGSPFVNSNDPDGPDNIWFTADDGFQLNASATAAHNAGVNIGLTTDITGQTRIGNPEPGAYEYVGAVASLPANVIAVDKDATGLNNGSSWANAYTSLKTALDAGTTTSGKEIWIAAGTYTPGSPNTNSFQMKDGVSIYGGFAGTEDTRSARNPASNVVILSGDLSNNDNYNANPFGNISENTITLMRGANATLDGVTIQGANNTAGVNGGGGMFNDGVAPIINNVIFQYNTCTGNGGGMSNRNSGANPVLTNVTFFKNRASGLGGGLDSRLSAAPSLSAVTFRENQAGTGGGMSSSTISPYTLERVSFVNNSSTLNAGGMYVSGASNVTVKNGVFVGNSTAGSSPDGNGGGIAMRVSGSTLNLYNVTFSNNTASNSGAGIYLDTPNSGVLYHTLNRFNVLYWNSSQVIPGSAQGSTNINVSLTGSAGSANDPFRNSNNPDGADGIARTGDDGLWIKNSPPAGVLNVGVTNSANSNVPAQDILNRNRQSNPEPGAYEYYAY